MFRKCRDTARGQTQRNAILTPYESARRSILPRTSRTAEVVTLFHHEYVSPSRLWVTGSSHPWLSGLVRGDVANPLCVVGKYRARLQAVTLLPFTAVSYTLHHCVASARERTGKGARRRRQWRHSLCEIEVRSLDSCRAEPTTRGRRL